MRSTDWRVIRFVDGSYGVCRTHEGSIQYDPGTTPGGARRFDDHTDAKLRADLLNGKPSLPRKMSYDRFREMTGHVNMTLIMRMALKHILVGGMTWRAAAETYGLTESGILRAMRRVAAANHPG